MKTRKRTLANFSFFDQKGIEQKLEQMASQGWMVCKAGNLFWTYEKTEPKKLRFAVTYFPGASELDPAPSERQLDKEELCAQDGWHLVLRWDAMQIFCTDREDPVPIETDPVPQVANIRRAMRNTLTGQLVNIAMVLWFLFLQCSQFSIDPVEYLSGTKHIFIFLMWTVLLLGDLFQLYTCFRWQTKAKKAAENGIFLSVKTERAVGWGLVAVSMLFLVMTVVEDHAALPLMVCLLAVMASGFFLAKWLMDRMKRKGVPRRINLVVGSLAVALFTLAGVSGILWAGISGCLPMRSGNPPVDTYTWNGHTFDIYDDPLPLQVEDLLDAQARWSKKADVQESALLSYGQYRQDALIAESAGNLDLQYSVIDVKMPFLYDFVKDRVLSARQDEMHDGFVFVDHYEPVDPALWDAREAYQLHWSGSILNTYLVCWENRIVEIKFFWEPDRDQIAAACEKLKP